MEKDNKPNSSLNSDFAKNPAELLNSDAIDPDLHAKLLKIARTIPYKMGKEYSKLAGFDFHDKWITLTEAGELLGKHKGVISRWADEGLLQDNGEKGKKRKIILSSVLLLSDLRAMNELNKNE